MTADVKRARDAPRAAVLWTGGKDSCLALHRAHAQGLRITHLVTFGPRDAKFLAHPIPVMKLQASALDLPHLLLEVHEPYDRGYEAALRDLKERCEVSHVVTGDLDDVNGHPSRIPDLCRSSGLELVRPLWKAERRSVLTEIQRGYRVVFSCVRSPPFDESWVGRTLDAAATEELEALHQQAAIDICGENGEYHTLVLDAPLFRRTVSLELGPVNAREDLLFLTLR